MRDTNDVCMCPCVPGCVSVCVCKMTETYYVTV